MTDGNNDAPGLATLMRKLGRTGLGALHNRGELLVVEWQEEKARLTGLLILAVALLFLGILAMIMLMTTIIFLFPEQRLHIAAGFTVLYLTGAVLVWLRLKALLKQEPFAESLEQVKQDGVWLETLK